MRIERLTVEEGFLAGLQIDFSEGLNVLIGERGTGKTSVIELLRFALGVGWFTEDARTRGHQQALAVLGDGRVTVTAFDGVERFTVTRTAQDDRAEREMSAVTVLAQNEIEALGVQPGGRLRLVDRFRSGRPAEDDAPLVISQLRAMTAEIQGLLAEVVNLEERAASLASVPAELEEALGQQAELLSSIAATEEQRTQLDSLQARHSELSVRAEALSGARSRIDGYSSQIQALQRGGLQLDEWPVTAGDPDLLGPIRNSFIDLAARVSDVSSAISGALVDVEKLELANSDAKRDVEEEARTLRVGLNRLQEGAGAITKKVDELRERRGQLDALAEMRSARSSRAAELSAQRDEVYDRLDAIRDARFESRSSVAEKLVQRLGPSIRVTVARSASTAGYVQELVNSLRGSGIHYNRLAPLLATELTPLELVVAAERLATDAVCAATDLARDRALTLLTHLRQSTLSDLISSPIDDGVTLELLDGIDYKATDRLSIGQRCTVVLPILLAADEAILVVDQPEDHLDNAYVTTTLVERLRTRASTQQLIFSSHNPNIPVLGEADQIIVLGSDGSRGFKLHQGALDEQVTVDYVTSLMEGGREAFRKRAEFYSKAWEQ